MGWVTERYLSQRSILRNLDSKNITILEFKTLTEVIDNVFGVKTTPEFIVKLLPTPTHSTNNGNEIETECDLNFISQFN